MNGLIIYPYQPLEKLLEENIKIYDNNRVIKENESSRRCPFVYKKINNIFYSLILILY